MPDTYALLFCHLYWAQSFPGYTGQIYYKQPPDTCKRAVPLSEALKMRSFCQSEKTCLFFSHVFHPLLVHWRLLAGYQRWQTPSVIGVWYSHVLPFTETCRMCLLVAWELEALLRHSWILVFSAILCKVQINPSSQRVISPWYTWKSLGRQTWIGRVGWLWKVRILP